MNLKKLTATLLVSIMAAAMIVPQIIATADSGHGYYAVYANSDGSVNGASVTQADRGYFEYDAENNALKDCISGYNSDSRVTYTLSQSLPASYRYIKMMYKYNDLNTTGIAWLVDNQTSGDDLSECFCESAVKVANWGSKVFAFPNKANASITKFAHFMAAKAWCPQGYGYDGNSCGSVSVKYFAFFESESDAISYDASIKSFSLGGYNGDIDPISHTIVFDFSDEAVTPSDFKGQIPDIVADTGAVITRTSGNADYKHDMTYNVRDVEGKDIEYTVSFTYNPDISDADSTQITKVGPLYTAKHKIASGETEPELILAVYDEGGKLVRTVKSNTVFENTLIARTNISDLKNGSYKAKAFVWTKDTIEPCCETEETPLDAYSKPTYDLTNTANNVWHEVPLVSESQLANGMTGGEGAQAIFWISRSRDGATLMSFSDAGTNYISTDRGEKWVRGARGVNAPSLGNGEIDPNNSQRVIAVTHQGDPKNELKEQIRYIGSGLYLSTDTGYSYHQVMIFNDKAFNFRQAFAWDATSYDASINGSRYCYFSTESKAGEPYNDDYRKASAYEQAQGYNEGYGLYRSSDGGESWELINSNFGKCVVAVGESDGAVFVGAADGLYRSNNHGDSFTKVMDGYVGSVTTVETRPNNIYVSRKDCIMVSTDRGMTFTAVSSSNFPGHQWPGNVTKNLRVSPANPDYMVISDNPTARDVRIWYSTDAEAESRYMSHIGSYVSHDGGRTWTKTRYDSTYDFYTHQPRWKVTLWDPYDENIAWTNSDWMERSSDGGATFRCYSDGNCGTCINSPFILNVYNPDRYLVPAQDYTGAITLDGGKTFKSLHQAHTSGDYASIVHSHTYGGYIVDEDTWFFCSANTWESSESDLVITHDGGRSYQYIGKVNSGARGNYCLQSQVEPNVYFAGDMRSEDGGYTWAKMTNVKNVATYNPYGDELFGIGKADSRQVYVSHDAGRTWEKYMYAKKAYYTSYSGIGQIAYDGVNDILYFTQADFVSKFENGIQTKLNCSIMKDNWRTVLTVDPIYPNIVYTAGVPNASTENGFTSMDYTRSIFRSCDGGTTWQIISSADTHEPGKTDSIVRSGPMVGNYYTWAMFVHPETGEVYAGMPNYGLYKFSAPYQVN